MKWIFRSAILLILFLAVFFLTPIVWSMYVSDPLPQTVRTKFDRLAHIGRMTEVAMQYERTSNHPGINPVEDRYTQVATRFNSLIDRAIEGVKQNRIDEGFLDSELDKLLSMANAFNVERDSYRPVSYTPKDVREYLDAVRDFADYTMKDWRELASKKEEMRRITIRQLQDMRWLPWGAKRSDISSQPKKLAENAIAVR